MKLFMTKLESVNHSAMIMLLTKIIACHKDFLASSVSFIANFLCIFINVTL